MSKVGIFSKLGCSLIGWNPNILKECGEASHRTLKRYVSALIILSTIWGTIGFCFADKYIGLSELYQKISVALVFILIIICIERYIILHVGKLGITGVIRFILAFLMAVLGSTIFDQIIFQNDIKVKMDEIRTEQINEEIPKRLKFIDAEIIKLNMTIDSISVENMNLYQEINKRPTIVATDVNTVNRQIGVDEDGKPKYEKTSTISKRNVENPLTGKVKSNEKYIEEYQKQLNILQDRKLTTAETVRDEFSKKKSGFLEELVALHRVIEENSIAFTFYLLLLCFLTFLEMLVVMSKGGDGACDYDLIVEHQLRIKRETLKKTEDGLLLKN